MKAEYESLLKSGMFWEFHPELTGEWNKDKVQWKKIYNKLKKYRNGSNANEC
jgi:hypothetical protein